MRPAFFLPFAEDDPESAEEAYEGIKRFAEEQTGWHVTDRRIFRIVYQHHGEDHEVEVGSHQNRLGETCIAILETPQCFLACTKNRGVLRGGPMLVGIPHTVVDFD